MARMNLRLPDDADCRIAGYAVEKGLTKTDAILQLAEIGLAVERENLYASKIARITRDTIRAEFGVFARRLEDYADERDDINGRKLDATAAASYAAMLACSEEGRGRDTSTLEAAGAYMAYGFDAGDAIAAASRHAPASDPTEALWEG